MLSQKFKEREMNFDKLLTSFLSVSMVLKSRRSTNVTQCPYRTLPRRFSKFWRKKLDRKQFVDTSTNLSIR